MIATVKQPDDIDKRIIDLYAEGMTAKQIGYEMNLSQRTVEARIVVMRKYYNCKSVTELVVKLKNVSL